MEREDIFPYVNMKFKIFQAFYKPKSIFFLTHFRDDRLPFHHSTHQNVSTNLCIFSTSNLSSAIFDYFERYFRSLTSTINIIKIQFKLKRTKPVEKDEIYRVTVDAKLIGRNLIEDINYNQLSKRCMDLTMMVIDFFSIL